MPPTWSLISPALGAQGLPMTWHPAARRLRLFVLVSALLALPIAARAETCVYAAGAARVTLPDRPFGVKPTPDGCWLFVSLIGTADSGGAIVALRNTGGAFHIHHVVRLSGQPGGMSLSHDARLLAAAAQDRTLLLDVAKLKQAGSQPLLGEIAEGQGTGAIYAQFARDDRLLFVSEEQRGRLAVIDVERALAGGGDQAVVNRVVTGRGPVGLALSPDGAQLFATSEFAPSSANWPAECAPMGGQSGARQPEGMLQVIETASAASEPYKSVGAVAAAGCGPVRVALSPDGATAWVTARTDNALLAFQTRRIARPNPTVDRHSAGTAPVGVAVRPDGAEVWVANSDRFSANGDGTLMGLSVAGKGSRKITTGRFPRELAFLTDGCTLVATVFGSSELQFVPTGRPDSSRGTCAPS
jgi:hypothetical protein